VAGRVEGVRGALAVTAAEPVEFGVREMEAVHGHLRGPRFAGAVQRPHQVLRERGLARARAARDAEDRAAPVPGETAGTAQEVVEGQRHRGECVTWAAGGPPPSGPRRPRTGAVRGTLSGMTDLGL